MGSHAPHGSAESYHGFASQHSTQHIMPFVFVQKARQGRNKGSRETRLGSGSTPRQFACCTFAGTTDGQLTVFLCTFEVAWEW